uniref:C-type lectin domain-containing protein n=1 Tax=Mastacembelus armatus TaxID=205130 RepID=A0A3Q3RWF7_9TELE
MTNHRFYLSVVTFHHCLVPISTCCNNLCVMFLIVQQSSLNEPNHPEGELCMKCERGWELHGGMCYYFSNIEASWQESESKCQYLGGALAFLDEKVTSKMNYVADQYWIGLTDLEEEGEWLWVDGSPLDQRLSFWQFHEPDNWKVENPDGENCARMGLQDGSCKLKSWFDKSCRAHLKSICEKPATVSAQLQL